MNIKKHIPWSRSTKSPLPASLSSVSKKLARAYQRESKLLVKLQQTPAETRALHAALRSMKQAKAAIDRMLRNNEVLNTDHVISLLTEQRAQQQKLIEAEKLDTYFRAGLVSSLTLNLLFLAENGIDVGLRPDLTGRTLNTSGSAISRVSITSDTLYQMHHNLFPAERMLVASGQRTGTLVKIGAVFEVTGECGLGHVNADPARLGRALIAMDLTDTHFAMWVHSHPGTGPECTRPSSIDLTQHEDWLRDYSPNLVSAIMVKDRWIRFWGTALEDGQLEIEVLGTGTRKEEANASIYRLEQ